MDSNIQKKDQQMSKLHHSEKLTSTEMGKLWIVYTGNSVSICVLSFFLQHIEDQEIKTVLENALSLSKSLLQQIKEIFIEENFPLPVGYTDDDVNLGAPRLFSDEFYLHYLKYTGKAGLSIYSIAVALVSRKDIQDFFKYAVNATVDLILDVNNALKSKGLGGKPPEIPSPEKVDFIKKQHYLSGFFGNNRSLNALEIAHLHSTIENEVVSKALLLAFQQVAEQDKVKQFFSRGKELSNKHIKICSEYLNKENLPALPLLDHLVSASTIAPFSDKMMVAHKFDMFSMKIRSFGNSLSLSGRHDLGVMYSRFVVDAGAYVEDAANIMIDQGWMEQPPKAIDRDALGSE